MTTASSVIQFGHPTLQQVAQPVEDVTAPAVQILIDTLIRTMMVNQGVGIAAPQINQAYRICIVASRPNARYPEAPQMDPIAMINPEIIAASDTMVSGWEGCLSVPGVRGLVLRHQTITIAYWDRQGQRQKQELTDFVARIVQHELDHLNGMVFVDRVKTTTDLVTEQTYQQQSFP